MRDGQAVIQTTIAEIKEDPEAWDGKWVRLEGWIDDKSSVLSTPPSDENVDSIKLDPQRHPRNPDGTDYWKTVRPAVVSGKVDLTCWRFWTQNLDAASDRAAAGALVLLDLWAAGPIEYCNRVGIAPHLVHVISQSVAELSQ